jgi:hypothetical protein
MVNKVGVAVAGAVVAVGVVLGGIFVFAGSEGEAGSGGPAPTTRLSLSDQDPGPSGTEPEPKHPYRPVPAEQVDGTVIPVARTAGRNLYIPVQDDDCVREQVWPRGEHDDRVEVEIRPLPMTPPPGLTTGADGTGSYGCIGRVESDGPYAVIELAEPLGERRLVVKHMFGVPPS